MGVITDAYHLRGLVKIKTFTDKPDNICTLKCQDESGNAIKIEKATAPNTYRINDVNDRTMAEKIIGTKIYVNREDLPQIDSDEEFYMEELQNVPVFDTNNVQVGHVGGCFNFGAGDILEIVFADDREEMYLFTRENFPEVSLKRVVIARMDID